MIAFVELSATTYTPLTSNNESTSAIHTTIPPVLDRIVTSSFKPPCDFCPALSHISDHSFNFLAFFGRDRVMVQAGFKVLMISLSALFWRPRIIEVRGYPHPVIGTLIAD